MNRGGFTLLEVLIALLILAFLSIFTVQSIDHALKTKVKVQRDIDKTSAVRDALRVMERDINMAFNYHDTYIELYNMTQKQRQQNAQNAAAQPAPTPAPGPPGTPAPAPTAAQQDPHKYDLKTEKIWTKFIGEPEALDFTTLSNVRMMENSAISSQAEIGYHLKPCRRRSTQTQASNCLWRRVANYIHEDITKDGQETVLLENVTKFSLRYLGPGRAEDEWIDTWVTDERGDDITKNKFPWAVEVTIEVKDTTPEAKDKPLRMTMVAALRNPNNPNPNDPKDPLNAGTPNANVPPNGIQPQPANIPPPPSPAPH